MPKTTPELRGKIIGLHKAGIKKTSIASRLNINVKTVDLYGKNSLNSSTNFLQ